MSLYIYLFESEKIIFQLCIYIFNIACICEIIIGISFVNGNILFNAILSRMNKYITIIIIEASRSMHMKSIGSQHNYFTLEKNAVVIVITESTENLAKVG